jgi:hypothetical protein
MPQRIHQRLPYRAASPRDFGSRYDDNRLNLSPDSDAAQPHTDGRRKQRERRPWQQAQPLNGSRLKQQRERQKEQEDSREQRERDRPTE